MRDKQDVQSQPLVFVSKISQTSQKRSSQDEDWMLVGAEEIERMCKDEDQM